MCEKHQKSSMNLVNYDGYSPRAVTNLFPASYRNISVSSVIEMLTTTGNCRITKLDLFHPALASGAAIYQKVK